MSLSHIYRGVSKDINFDELDVSDVVDGGFIVSTKHADSKSRR